jgi:glycerol-3-phosphate dehydrogenase (NAD(P)+)
MMKTCILGAGNLGTTLAIYLQKKVKEVRLWTQEADVVESIRLHRRNPRYLPGVELPPGLFVSSEVEEVIAGAEMLILAVPSHGIRSVIRLFAPFLKNEVLIVNFAKGLEPSSGKRLSQVIREELEGRVLPIVVISGPSIAKEILEGIPTFVNVASENLKWSLKVKEIMEGPSFFLYPTDDVIGVEVGGAFKNVFAIGAGLCDGLGFGTNTKAAILTKSMAELILLGESLGAKKETLYGLAGLGDLLVTSFSPHSRNRRFGEKIGKGKTPEEAEREIGQTVEGINATKVAKRIGEEKGLKLPIVESLYRLLFEGENPIEVFKTFL